MSENEDSYAGYDAGGQRRRDDDRRRTAPTVDRTIPSALDYLNVAQTDWMGRPVTNPTGNPVGTFTPPGPVSAPRPAFDPNTFDIHWFQNWGDAASRAGFGGLLDPIRNIAPDNTRGWLLGIARADPFNPSIPTPAGSSLAGYFQQTPGALTWLQDYIKRTVGRHLA